MTCRELTEFLMDYLADAVPPPARAAFEEHLAECEDCVAYVRGYEATVALGKAAFRDPDAPVPADVPEELVQAVLRARRTSAR